MKNSERLATRTTVTPREEFMFETLKFYLRVIRNMRIWRKAFPTFNTMIFVYPREIVEDLGIIAERYKTDKGGINIDGTSIHGYTDFYRIFFESRKNEIRNVLEFGIGSNDSEVPSNMGKQGIPGASLRMWREYFPKAQITGLDIDPKTMLQENRISTAIVNQLKRESIADFLANENKLYDLIIEDGLHTLDSILNSFEECLKCLHPSGYFIVEDLDSELVKGIQAWVEHRGDVEGFFVAFRESTGRTRGGYLFVARRTN